MSVVERLKGIFTKPFAVAVVIAIAIGVTVGFFVSKHRQWLETNARQKLKELARAELTYEDRRSVSGNFSDLQREALIPADGDLEHFVSGYKFIRFDVDMIETDGADNSGFTIVVIPRDRRYQLRTFSICEDCTVRVAPLPGLSDVSLSGGAPCAWDPAYY